MRRQFKSIDGIAPTYFRGYSGELAVLPYYAFCYMLYFGRPNWKQTISFYPMLDRRMSEIDLYFAMCALSGSLLGEAAGGIYRKRSE